MRASQDPGGPGYSVTPKDRYRGMMFHGHTIKEHLGRSPDRADAVCYLYMAIRELNAEETTINRPLMLITPEEELALALKEDESQPRETAQQRAQREFNEHLAEIMGWEDDGRPEKPVDFPSFL